MGESARTGLSRLRPGSGERRTLGVGSWSWSCQGPTHEWPPRASVGGLATSLDMADGGNGTISLRPCTRRSARSLRPPAPCARTDQVHTEDCVVLLARERSSRPLDSARSAPWRGCRSEGSDLDVVRAHGSRSVSRRCRSRIRRGQPGLVVVIGLDCGRQPRPARCLPPRQVCELRVSGMIEV